VELTRDVAVAGPAPEVFALVDDLGEYPGWMDLVHDVELDPLAAADRPAWDVELRAHVGPFARSKRLRMARVVHDPPHRVVFERAEVDGRSHAPWTLDARVEPSDRPGDVVVTMHLHYGGSLWTGAVLQRVLDDHVVRGAANLVAQRAAASGR
jgi:hypothetical protein